MCLNTCKHTHAMHLDTQPVWACSWATCSSTKFTSSLPRPQKWTTWANTSYLDGLIPVVAGDNGPGGRKGRETEFEHLLGTRPCHGPPHPSSHVILLR